MLPKASRLTARDIESLLQGRSVFGTLLSIRFRPADKTKFAVTASKKAAPRAVAFTAHRRKGYKALRGMAQKLRSKAFVMVMPKKECLSVDVEALAAEISALLTKAGLL